MPSSKRHAPALDCYPMHEPTPEMRPGRGRRDWMDDTNQRYAYRCLPLTMANSTGWEILCPFDLEIEWNGGEENSDLVLSSPTPGARVDSLALAHFRHGILTFHTGYMFRTPPGWAVWASGAPNLPKDGIAPLSGLIETDWLPFPFTMNWKMTRPGRARFAKGEPFCFVTLLEHNRLEEVQPTLRSMDDDPQLARDYADWTASRTDFLERLENREDSAIAEGWQRSYMRGMTATGEPGGGEHVTKRRLKGLKSSPR